MNSKQRKEEHVSGHTGSTIWEINLILFVLHLSYWLNKIILSKFKPKTLFLFEFIFLITPLLLSITFTEYRAYLITTLLFGIALFSINLDQYKITNSSKHESFIIAFRSYLQIFTVVAILAVDFHVFPRNLAKTETFGTSLMDIGVGAFVFSSGLVAGPKLKLPQATTFSNFYRTLKQTAIPMGLGLIRVFATKAVDYQEHVTEYGMHWNFFVTLGSLPLLVFFQNLLLPKLSLLMVSLSILVGYQVALSRGLEDFIINAPRLDLFSMNREGICSLIGIVHLIRLLWDFLICWRDWFWFNFKPSWNS